MPIDMNLINSIRELKRKLGITWRSLVLALTDNVILSLIAFRSIRYDVSNHIVCKHKSAINMVECRYKEYSVKAEYMMMDHDGRTIVTAVIRTGTDKYTVQLVYKRRERHFKSKVYHNIKGIMTGIITVKTLNHIIR